MADPLADELQKLLDDLSVRGRTEAHFFTPTEQAKLDTLRALRYPPPPAYDLATHMYQWGL